METIFISLLSGFASSVITIIYSLKRFSSERWWEKKSEEYSRIIKELTDLQNCAYKWDDYYWDIIEGSNNKTFTDEEITELVNENKLLRESIRKTAMAGSFLISKDASEELEQLLNETNEISDSLEDAYESVQKEYKLIKMTIKRIRACAKADLGVK